MFKGVGSECEGVERKTKVWSAKRTRKYRAKVVDGVGGEWEQKIGEPRREGDANGYIGLGSREEAIVWEWTRLGD